jgi:3-phosphoshikimate 1-carboxyvinyltransferase
VVQWQCFALARIAAAMLPELIEIVPLTGPVSADIPVPGSKSITNRALIRAALAQGQTVLRGALWSEDTQVMVACLQQLGFEVQVEPDAQECSNRTITVGGLGGRLPNGGTVERPLELFVGNAGTSARFLTALTCLGQGVYRLQGVPRMHERPQAALFEALRQLGYQVLSPNDRLPATIHGTGPRRGACQVSMTDSSQFASALLLCAEAGGWNVEVLGENAEESSYVDMTRHLILQFPAKGGLFAVEPDASSGAYFIAADWLLRSAHSGTAASEPLPAVRVPGWPQSGWQIDAAFPQFLPLPRVISRQRDLGDSLMMAVVLAPFSPHPVRFSELARLRVQECERVAALRTELARCGAKVVEQGETLTVYPSALAAAEIETYQDHRMAMCFAILGLKVTGIKIKNPACVKKTFPNFFQKLATRPPAGLGAIIREPRSGRSLLPEELFAD